MPTNIEIKASVADLDALRARALPLATSRSETIAQHDVFFAAPRGRLKLRIFDDTRGELIAYERPDATDPQPSRYTIVPTGRPGLLRTALAGALGEVGEVVKQRELLRVGRTRVHLDTVEGLGTFMELEVVLADGDDEAEGVREAEELMTALGIAEGDLLTDAYVDMLARGRSSPR